MNLSRTDPEGWERDCAPQAGPERIIYELHVKEFSWDASGGFPEEYRGKYKAFTCPGTTLYNDGIHPTGLDYLQDLGVTHVQIMPAYDYGSVNEAGEETEFNWGYDPVNYNVPEGSPTALPVEMTWRANGPCVRNISWIQSCTGRKNTTSTGSVLT